MCVSWPQVWVWFGLRKPYRDLVQQLYSTIETLCVDMQNAELVTNTGGGERAVVLFGGRNRRPSLVDFVIVPKQLFGSVDLVDWIIGWKI